MYFDFVLYGKRSKGDDSFLFIRTMISKRCRGKETWITIVWDDMTTFGLVHLYTIILYCIAHNVEPLS